MPSSSNHSSTENAALPDAHRASYSPLNVSFNDRRDEYASLLQEEDEPHDTEEKVAFAVTSPSAASNNRLERLVRIAVIIIALCTIVDVLLVLSLGIQYYKSRAISPDDDWENLELRSSYVNLDQLYSQSNFKSSKHAPIINHARAFVQISSTEPDKVFPPYRNLIQLDDGFVPPNERRLLMTPQTSTVAQFRAMDYGMELCSLAVVIPAQNETEKMLSNAIHGTDSIEIWSLPVKGKLNMQKLTWNTRPQPRTYFGSLPLSYGASHELPPFPCVSGTYHTFEFACPSSNSNCHVDVMGVGTAASGLYLRQYQTA